MYLLVKCLRRRGPFSCRFNRVTVQRIAYGTFEKRLCLLMSALEEEAMPGQNKTLEDLFLETLKDMYYAERKILIALPKMAKAAHSDQLRTAFEKHAGETEGQVQRLQQIFKMMKQAPKGKTCQAILGLVEE